MFEIVIIAALAGIIHIILRGEARKLWFTWSAGCCAFVVLPSYIGPGVDLTAISGGVIGVVAPVCYFYGICIARSVERVGVKVIGAMA
jgi:hypothetical protein